MQVTFYPKHLAGTVLGIAVMWLALSLALGSRADSAVFVVLSVTVGVIFDLFFFVNPTFWSRWRRTR